MATFHSNSIDLNKLFHDSHSKLIKDICRELDETGRVDEITEKFLTKAFMKIKAH